MCPIFVGGSLACYYMFSIARDQLLFIGWMGDGWMNRRVDIISLRDDGSR